MALIELLGVLKEIRHVKALAQCLAHGTISMNFCYYMVILAVVLCAVGSTHMVRCGAFVHKYFDQSLYSLGTQINQFLLFGGLL